MHELGEMGLLTTPVRWPEAVIPDQDLYQPYVRGWATFAPWLRDSRIAAMVRRVHDRGSRTYVDGDRAWTLICAFQQTRRLTGEVWETGVYQGGSATLLKLLVEASAMQPGCQTTTMRLFDSFEGMPETTSELDQHKGGDFSDCDLRTVQETVGSEDWIDFRRGWIPDTFAGLESASIRLAHVDVDLYKSVLDCCEFIYPRLIVGGMMVFDDYGVPTCAGARAAVDSFFRSRPEAPFSLINGQCVVTRLPV